MSDPTVRQRPWAIQLGLAGLSGGCLLLAFLLRFDFRLPAEELPNLYAGLLLGLPLKWITYYAWGLHRGWRGVLGVSDLRPLAAGNAAASCGFTAALLLARQGGFPRSVFFLDLLLSILAMSAVRMMLQKRAESHSQAAQRTPRRQSGHPASHKIPDISVNDLLNREPVQLDLENIRLSLRGRAVLVTGAAGSIGSEICRQVASFGPRVLVMLDQAESPLFLIDHELRARYPEVQLEPVIADIRDRGRVVQVMEKHLVEVVFHAAAYKHVPLMEGNPVTAAHNNILGTWNVAWAAARTAARSFVLISTDKAVNPSSVMGATKRAAELLVSSLSNSPMGALTKFVAVRFGNVLASNGSVIPIFQSQIAAGGPVTVTHPEMRRYFMTIREAVELVLQASILSDGPEVFELDMGQPVRIMDLAHNMIQLAGLVPGQDIEIRLVGMRPGEKLYEELLTSGERVKPTRHPNINILQQAPSGTVRLEQWLHDLSALVEARNSAAVVAHLHRLIPEYRPLEPAPVAERPRVLAACAG